MSDREPQDSIYQITGQIKGEITLGHLDIFVRYLKDTASCDTEDAQTKLNRLKKVDPRIWGMAISHPDFESVFDAILMKAALGIINPTKEQREWFKIAMSRAGFAKDQNKPGASKAHNVVINVKQLDVQPGGSHWVDPSEGTLPDSMKKGIRGLDPEVKQ